MQRVIGKGLLAIVLAVGVAGCILAAAAQEPGEQLGGRAQFAGMQHVAGIVVSVAGDVVTVKAEDGTVYQISTTPNTRVMKGEGVAVKVADLKAGDGALAVGNTDAPNKTLHAAFLMVTDVEQLKKMRENLGKTYIAGKVTAIDSDNLKMTVLRQDGVSQVIGFDETTSFKRGGHMGRGRGFATRDGAPAAPAEGGESITLADIKVGDNVLGTGSLKGGVFVPQQLNVATPHARHAADGARPASAQHPATPQ